MYGQSSTYCLKGDFDKAIEQVSAIIYRQRDNYPVEVVLSTVASNGVRYVSDTMTIYEYKPDTINFYLKNPIQKKIQNDIWDAAREGRFISVNSTSVILNIRELKMALDQREEDGTGERHWRRSDLSDDISDDEMYEENGTDDESHKTYAEPTTSKIYCKCGRCMSINDGGSYCCNEISKTTEMRGNSTCFTEMRQFIDCIENLTVLELTAFAVNKGRSFPQREDVEQFNKLMRYTSYKTFLHMLNFRGLETEKMLPDCVERRIRELYPSKSGQYAGFQVLDQVNNSLTNFNSQ